MGNPTNTPAVEARHDGSFIVAEPNSRNSRDGITLSGGARIYSGTVLGRKMNVVAAALGSNAGNGTFGAISAAVGALPGAFTVEFDDPTHFIVSDPNGQEIGHGTTNAAFSAGGIGFTITAGGTAFAPGDSFTLTAADTATYAPLDFTAYGGAIASAILFGTKDVTTGDRPAMAIARRCEVNGSELIWPAGATVQQIATGAAQLLAQTISVR